MAVVVTMVLPLVAQELLCFDCNHHLLDTIPSACPHRLLQRRNMRLSSRVINGTLHRELKRPCVGQALPLEPLSIFDFPSRGDFVGLRDSHLDKFKKTPPGSVSGPGPRDEDLLETKSSRSVAEKLKQKRQGRCVLVNFRGRLPHSGPGEIKHAEHGRHTQHIA